MNQWSRRRKRFVLSMVFSVLIGLIGVPVFFLVYKAPTCFDGRQNGDEAGVDCGGSCQLLCTAQSLPLVLKGDTRVLKVSDGVYELVALVENSNISAEVYRAEYIFKLYDGSSSIPLRVFEGSTFVPKGSTFAIFEGPFNIESGVVPTRATLEWKEESIVWQRNTRDEPELVVTGLTLLRESESPRLEATLENISLEDVSNIDLVALISDETGSVFAASKTFVDALPASKGAKIIFTWPRPFDEVAVGTEVLVRILPDRSFIR